VSTPDLDDDSWLDEQLQLALTDLPASCAPDLRRLLRSLVYGPPFQWFVLDVLHEGLRQRLMMAIDGVLHAAQLSSTVVRVDASVPEVPDLEALLVQQAQSHQVIHVLPQPGWLTPQHWAQLNIRRERLAKHARARQLFWLNADSIVLAASSAPDLWAWRAGVYTFTAEPEALAWQLMRQSEDWKNNLSLRSRNQDIESKRKRIKSIEAWLNTDPPYAMKVDALQELGGIFYEMGDYDAALAHLEQVALPAHREHQNYHLIGEAIADIADILVIRGDIDGAESMYRESLLISEKTNDSQDKIQALYGISKIKFMRGDLNKALSILEEEAQPIVIKSGSEVQKASLIGRLSDLLLMINIGDSSILKKVLSMKQNEELPIYEQMGDKRNIAITLAQISSLMMMQGEVASALDIQGNKVIPILEGLGDSVGKAITLVCMGICYLQANDFCRAREKIEEASSIFEEVNMPLGLAWLELIKNQIMSTEN